MQATVRISISKKEAQKEPSMVVILVSYGETDEFCPPDFINWNLGYAAYLPSAYNLAPWTVIPTYNGDMRTVQSQNHSLYGAGRAAETPDMPDTAG
ncbi:hypothetical protein DL771_009160 [Monosporascus sp. 5C6A]|nr:hypothetical protein DL771_009160 [Monosporascus sp. 5C6A]